MSDRFQSDLLSRVRQGDESAWRHVIETYEGRLQAFAISRLGDAALAEDVVQETFVGFLTGLPNYDEERTALESFLFRIAAYKITDVLRRQGRRQTFAMTEGGPELSGGARKASSMARSREGAQQKKRHLEETLRDQIRSWIQEAQYERLQCCELLFVRGWPNKVVAESLDLTEQQVANHKQALLQKLKKHDLPELAQ
ncbi:RNA polymerase sigma factor [Rubinisphaera margarita]|uniref:RNA polymerase sigma factor n=1 Tax=Rubinisphaera margarita TaxID=2909586 RepID=UPI001EE94F44|nr:sigma-70 family RNA polymerase sigma factor [Rubinisphaera margarita]MCG6156653.1 sigma-70 family RNA polymerase sigma factor [Rubinisphaera margarita]